MTPEQEEQVRAALAAAGPDEPTPMPPEVVARLQGVLDELAEPRVTAQAQAQAGEPDPRPARSPDGAGAGGRRARGRGGRGGDRRGRCRRGHAAGSASARAR